MSTSVDDAQGKFWQVPELIEYMLPFLEGKSILNLAKAHPLTIKVLKNSSKVWMGIVNEVDEPWWTEERDIQVLNDLLQMMGAPESFLLELLHAICGKFASQEDQGFFWERRREEVMVSCPCHMAHHSVAPIGFRILESVEAALGSTIQKVERVAIQYLTGQDWTGDEDLDPEDWLNALGARMKRQHEMVIAAKLGILFCDDQNDAENARALLTRCHWVELDKLWVTGDIGMNGWAALSKALSMFPGGILDQVEVDDRQDMLGGRREDLRSIWESLQEEDGAWFVKFGNVVALVRKAAVPGDENKSVNKWVGWEKLEQILVISEDEYWLTMESEEEEQE